MLCALGAGCLAHRSALADQAAANEDAAKELMRLGFAAQRKNDLETARAAFADAWQLRQHFAIALSLAEVEMRLGRYLDAAHHWEFVLESLPEDLVDKRDEAQARLKECKAHIGTLTLQVAPAGATVYADGERIGTAPLKREVYIAAGDHELYAEKDGERSPTHFVRLPGGSRFSFQLSIVTPGASTPASSNAAAGDSPEHAKTEPPPQAGSAQVPLLISSAALTVASAAVGTVFTLKSNAAGDEAADALAQAVAESAPGISPDSVCAVKDRPAACETAQSSLHDRDNFRNVAIGAFIATGVFACTTAATYWLWPQSSPSRATTGRTHVTPILGLGTAGATVSGVF